MRASGAGQPLAAAPLQQLRCGWPSPAPLLPCSISTLRALLQLIPHRSEALRQFNAILHIIPLLVVGSRKEADEVRELVAIAR